MASIENNGRNITFAIKNADGTPFHNLVLHKSVVDSVVMSLGDKITGDVYYKDNMLDVSMSEYITYDGVDYILLSPPTVVKEGIVSDNGDLKGMTKYSFEFYHPMCLLADYPFSDVAVSNDEKRYKSHDKAFNWIGKPDDFIAKLNKNLENTLWVVVKSDRFPEEKNDELSDVMSFDNNSIAEALKVGYETWGVPYIVSSLHQGEYYHIDANNTQVDYYSDGKRFVVIFGLPSNEILVNNGGEEQPFVFEYGQGVGLKNNSRTPRNNKIITRIAGYGSEDNIPYGYPQIVWYGDQRWEYTAYVNNDPQIDSEGKPHGIPSPNAYTLYKGIVGGAYVKLIHHPYTRKHLMPSIYSQCVFNKVSPYLEGGSANPNYDPDIELIDYYDAISGGDYDYPNEINPNSPSYESHEFDLKPELGHNVHIKSVTPINNDGTDADSWDDTMDEDGNYLQSYFKVTLPILSFDLYACAAITQEMSFIIRSGACLGCTFPAQVNWDEYKKNFYDSDGNFAPNGSQRDLTAFPKSNEESISIICQKEFDTFGVIMPNVYQRLRGESSEGANDGDEFAIIGISLPLSYITLAEEALDDEMKSYMQENNLHYFDYPLKFDEFFLANNVNILQQIRTNTIIRFRYGNELLQLFVKQLTIKYGDRPLPQYDITLTDNVEISLNQIGQVAADVERLGTLIAILRQTYGKNVWGELAKKLSKVNPDTAAGKITFADGAKFGDEHEITKDGDATLRVINGSEANLDELHVSDSTTNPVATATFGDTNDSLMGGQGTLITDDGRVQTSTLEVRGTMKVLDLVASQIHSLNGYYYFSDTMKIANVEPTITSYNGNLGYDTFRRSTTGETPNSYLVTFEKEYENDFLKFYNNDILLSVMTDLSPSSVSRETNDAGNAVLHNVTSQSWMHVTNTSEDENWVIVFTDMTPDDAGLLQCLVALYPNGSVPSGTNNPPQAGYYVARRGNDYIPSGSEPVNYEARQNSWCISVEDGRLTYYINQQQPNISDENYGIAIGKLPDITPVRNLGLVGDIGIYAKNLLVEHIYTVDWVGDVRHLTIDMGEWNATDAANNKYYFKRSTDGGVVTYTHCYVTHNGSSWVSTGTRTTDGTDNITTEPTSTNTSWVRVGYTYYYTTSETDDLDEGGVGQGAEEVIWRTDQSFFFQGEISGEENPYYYCEFRPYMWRKTTNKATATSNEVVIEQPHVIGVFGETGRNYIIQTNVDYIPIEDESVERTLIIETFAENGGVRAEFPCYCKVVKVAVDGTETILNNDSSSYPAGHYWEIEDVEILPTDVAIEIYINSNGIDIKETYIAKKQIVIQKAVKGDKGDKGDDGYAGALTRVFQDELIYGFTYYVETNDVVIDTTVANYHYQDYIAVPCGDYQSGYMVFKCINQYVHPIPQGEVEGGRYKISEHYKVAGAIRDFMTTNSGLGAGYWEEVEINAASAFFTNLIAQHAYIRMLTGSNFVITDDGGIVVAGMGNMTDSHGNQYYIWAGGANADNATFKVFADGTVDAMRGSFSGFLTSKETLVTTLNVDDYVSENVCPCISPEDGGTGADPQDRNVGYIFDMDKIGSTLSFFQTGRFTAKYSGTQTYQMPQGYGDIEYQNIHIPLPYDHHNEGSYTRETYLARYGGFAGGNVVNGLGLYRYFKVNISSNKISTTAAKQLTSVPSATSDEFYLYPFQYTAEIGAKARQLVGNKVTIRLYGEIYSGLTFSGIYFEKTLTIGNEWANSYIQNEATLHDVFTFEDIKKIIYGDTGSHYSSANCIVLECKQIAHYASANPSATDEPDYYFIGWIPTISFLGYYDRYTIGLPDITT